MVFSHVLAYTSRPYVNFVRGIRTEATRIDYDQALQTFMHYAKKTDPEQLINGSTTKMENRIMDFIDSQKKKGLSFSTIRQRVAAIRHFYEMNRVALSWKIVTRTIGRHVVKKDRGYTHEEIQKFLEIAKPREQAAILLMCSAGLRAGAVPTLKLKHLKKVDQYGVYMVQVYEGEPEEYATFTTPEAAGAIDRYLQYRERYGEFLTPESPLLREEFNKRDQKAARNPRPITDKSLRGAFREILVSSGVRKVVKSEGEVGRIRHDIKMLHGAKKFCATNMIRAKVEPTYREFMLSHKQGRTSVGVDTLEMIYDRPEASDLLSEYVKAIPFLTVSPEERLKSQVSSLKTEATQKEQEMEARIKSEVRKQIQQMLQDADLRGIDEHQKVKDLHSPKAKAVA